MRKLPVALLLACLALAGCGDDGGSGGGDDGGEVVLTIYVADEAVAEWTIESLEGAVEFVAITVDGDEQNGPRVLDVLEASGIEAWDTTEVLGKGEGRSFDIGVTISSDDVDEEWVFDVTKRGTLKLAAPDLPREQWVRDAGEIRIP